LESRKRGKQGEEILTQGRGGEIKKPKKFGENQLCWFDNDVPWGFSLFLGRDLNMPRRNIQKPK